MIGYVLQHENVANVCQAASPGAGPGSAKSPSQAADSGTLNAEIYTQDGDYIKDIEVNDLRNRYTLTKGSTQKMVNTPLVHEPTDTHRHSLLLSAFRVPWVCPKLFDEKTMLTYSAAATSGSNACNKLTM